MTNQWKNRDAAIIGDFAGLATDGSSLYAVGQTRGAHTDFVIAKYDQTGGQSWSTVSDGGGTTDYLRDVVVIGGRVFAVGYTNAPGAGGDDMVILEIHPSTGAVLSTDTYGGAQNDRANRVTTDGTELYVMGESRSFAQGGNSVGQNDAVLLRYNIDPFAVTTTVDGGAGSLRQAIINANSTPGTDTINLGAGTYTLTIGGAGENAAATGDLDITDNLTIVGAGADTTIIDASGLSDRVFEVFAGMTLDISGVTITGGNTSATSDRGGAINNLGTLLVTDSALAGNTAGGGSGGAIFNNVNSSTTIVRSTLSNNQAINAGGGGAIFNSSTGAVLTIINSTLSGNVATASAGGAIYNNASATVNLTNATLTNNNAGNGVGGGVYIEAAGTLNATNTIIAQNTPNQIAGTGSLAVNVNNIVSGNPLLGPLQNNGGTTDTHALLTGSPAIDAGTNTGAPATDQRGVGRPQNGTVDIGAFEVLVPIWTELSPAGSLPPVRIQHHAVYNDTDNRMIVFGGTNDPGVAGVPPLLNDVWVLSNADATGGTPTWTQLIPTGASPSQRSENAYIYDEGSNRMVLFGGNPNVGFCSNTVNDLWLLENADGTGGTAAWTPLSPTGSIPSPRGNHTLNYDSQTNRMILLGGNQACGPPLNELWVLEDANAVSGTPNWVQLSPTGASPGGITGHTTVYDETNNRLVAYNGNNVYVLEHASGIDRATGSPTTPVWSLLSPTPDPTHGSPPSMFGHSATYDPDSNEMIVFGGCCSGTGTDNRQDDVWLLQNANGLGGTPQWQKLIPGGSTPLPRDLNSAVYDTDSNLMIMFGGRGTPPAQPFSALNDTWLFNASGVVVNQPPNAPVDNDATANEVAEGASTGTSVGITAFANDPNGDTPTYTLTNDAGGRFDVGLNTGIVTVDNGNLLDGPDSHLITVQASDGLGGTSTANFTISVNNVAPTLNSVIVTSMINENGNATLDGVVIDPAVLDTFTLDIDWGDPLSPNDAQSFALGVAPLTKAADGIDWNPVTRSFSVDHQYLDDNPTVTSQDDYTINVSVSDDDATTLGTWSSLASAPIAVGGAGGFIGNDFYVAGITGTVPFHSSVLEVYDSTSNTWNTLTAPTLKRAGTTGDAVNGKLFVIGGCINYDCNVDTNVVEIYEPGVGWTTGTPMPTLRGIAASAAIGDKIYVASGSIGGLQVTKKLEIYDTVANTWSSGADMPTGREALRAAAVGGKLYVFGGYERDGVNTFVGTLDIYDPVANTWTSGTPMPTVAASMSVGVIDEKIYVAGGNNSTGTLAIVQVYDPATNTWSTDTNMLTARQQAAGGVYNGVFYVASGYDPVATTVLEAFTPAGPAVAQATVTVKNVAPQLANVSVTSMINENGNAILSGDVIDPGTLDTFTLDIDWGDPLSPGNTQSIALGTTAINSGGVTWNPITRQFTVDHQYLDDNPTATSQDDYTISVTVSDDDGGTSGGGAGSLPSGLVNYWSGDGSADDGVGGQDGTLQGDATFATGKVGQAFHFDGTGDDISLPGSFGGGSEFTVAAWVKTAATSGDFQAIFSSTAADFVHLQLNSGGNIGFYTPSFISLPIVSQTPTGVYRHIALSAQSGNSQLYVDGVQVGSSGATFGSITPSSSVRIGSGFAGTRFFNGDIDEIALYDRALDASEIAEVLDAGNAGQSLVANILTVTVKNVDPVGADQSYTTNEDVPLNIINVLAGTDDSGSFTVTDQGTLDTHMAVAGTFPTAQGGSVTIATNGSATYSPAPNFFGIDTFDFTVEDDDTGSDIATVTITVNAVNDEPDVVLPPTGGLLPGSEFQINGTSVSQQSGAPGHSEAAALSGGGFVSVWTASTDGSSTSIAGRIHDSNGNPVGGEFVVNAATSTTSGEQSNPSVAGLIDGGFVVTWHSFGPDGSDFAIVGQRYDANGQRVSLDGLTVGADQFLVNTNTSGFQGVPTVASLPNGGFVVTFFSNIGPTSNDVKARLYDSTGPVGPEFDVSVAPGTQANPSVAVLSNGDFAVAWHSDSGLGIDTSFSAVGVRLFDSAGTAKSGEILVNTTTSGTQNQAKVVALDAGGFAVAWDDRSTNDVKAQRFDQNAAKVGGELTLNATTLGDQKEVSVSDLPDGGFIAAWRSDTLPNGSSPSDKAVLARRFDSAGQAVGDEVVLSDGVTGAFLAGPSLATMANGSIAAIHTGGFPGISDTDGALVGQIVTAGSASTTDEDIPLTISGVTVSDIDAGTDPIAMSLSVNDGSLALTNTTGLTFSDADGSDGTLAFTGSQADITAAFAASIVYTPDQDFNGSDTLTITANDQGSTGSGGAQQDSELLSITVNAVNDEPSFAKGADQNVLEDSGPHTVAGWATDISVGPTDESGQTLAFVIDSNNNTSLFAAGPAVDANGQLTYTLAPDANGSATIGIKLTDDGGTVNGGVDESPVESFDINVTAVNDKPSFTAVDPPAVDQDLGPQTVVVWATFDSGPANESGQTATYFVTNVAPLTPGFFAVAPAIDASGTLTYQSAPGVFGSATFDVHVQDSGGTLNGGDDTSAIQTFTITIIQTNTPPTTTGIADVEVGEDAPDTVINLFAAFDDAEDIDADLTFIVTNNTNAGLFTSTTIDGVAGTLTLNYAPDTTGTADITVRATDTGTLFVETTFTVTVLSAQDQLDNLIDDVLDDLVTNGPLNNGQGNALTSKLQNAINKLNQGNINAGINQLNSFLNQINSLVNSGTLTPAEAQPFIDAANAAIASALPGSPLMATTVGSQQQAAAPVSAGVLNLAASHAIDFWSAEGATSSQIASLRATPIHIADLPGHYLGAASLAGGIWLDGDAAGHGWYVGVGGVTSHAIGSQVDLLSAVTHEMGHVIGLEHGNDHGVMRSHLDVGIRTTASSSSPSMSTYVVNPLYNSFPTIASRRIDVAQRLRDDETDLNLYQSVAESGDLDLLSKLTDLIGGQLFEDDTQPDRPSRQSAVGHESTELDQLLDSLMSDGIVPSDMN